VATKPQILWEKRASQILKYCSGQNTNIVRHFVLFSDYVITIYVITSRAIIATPSVRWTIRRTVQRCVRLSPSGGHTSDIQRTNAGHIYGHRTQPRNVRRTVRRTVPSCEHHIKYAGWFRKGTTGASVSTCQ